MDENEEFEFRMRAEQETQPPPSATAAPAEQTQMQGLPGPTLPDSVGKLAAMADRTNPNWGGVEAGLQMATGALATPVAGIAGLVAGARGASNPGDVVQQTQEALTYQPRSPSGQRAAGILNKPFELLAKGGDAAGGKVAEVTESPGLGAAVNTAIQAAPLLLGRGGKAPARALPKPIEAAPVADTAVSRATGAGYKLTPSQVGNKAGSVAEGLSGQVPLERKLSHQNAKVTNEIARKELALPEGKITHEVLNKAKAESNQAYSAVARTGRVATDATWKQEVNSITDRSGSKSFAEDTPPAIRRLKQIYGNKAAFDAGDAVAKVRQLRADSRKNFRSPSPEDNALGHAQSKLAEALEGQLERHAESIGKPELVRDLRAARTRLAKIHSVQSALRGTDISAKALAKQQERGAPLSGGLKTIADAYGSFDKVLQDVSKIRGSGPFSVVDGLAAGVGFYNPALLAGVAARPLTRAYLASESYQRAHVRPKGATPKVAPRNALRATDLTADRKNALAR